MSLLESENSRICIECNICNGKRISHLDVILCDICSNLDKYKLITKTIAKNDYFLNEDDLENLQYFNVRCSYKIAKLYKKMDIMIKASIKHNLILDNLADGLNEIKKIKDAKSVARKEKMQSTKQAKLDKRKTDLTNALENIGLVLRNDSKLCQMYIDGKTDDLDNVVRRMCEMKYLYDYCHMDECKDIAYKEHCDEIKAGYYPDFSVSEIAERIALKKYSNGKYPINWPWM